MKKMAATKLASDFYIGFSQILCFFKNSQKKLGGPKSRFKPKFWEKIEEKKFAENGILKFFLEIFFQMSLVQVVKS